jgi:poly(A)-specific ribonuclease
VFPRIVDTKYLATHAEGDLNASPNLEDIAESLSDQPLPHIVTHADHPKYQDTKAFHEAGYDSLLTATIMIKLAAKLGVERNVSIPTRVADRSSDEESFKSAKSSLDVSDFVRDGREKVDHPVPLPPVEQPVQNQQKTAQKQPKTTQNQPKKKLNKKQREEAKREEAQQRKFQTQNIFDTLRGESSSSSTEEEEEEEKTAPVPGMNGDGTGWDKPVESTRTWEGDVFIQDKTEWVKIDQMQREPMELIPSFDDSTFWSEFGNTLRVFGTEEAVLRIADWKG